MDRDQIHAATAQERRRIADLIDDLDEAQLATPSLCAGWDVKTVAAHLVITLAGGIRRVMWLAARRGSPDRAIDELARRSAQRSATEIAASLRDLADHRYWRPPPQAPGLLAEVLAHSGDIRIPLGLSLDLDPQPTAIALDFLTGPVPFGLVPLGRLRGIRLQATDMDRTWGKGQEIRGPAAKLLMAAVGRTSVLDALDGPGVPVLRQRMYR
ncbi:MAG TPA: maleylpyruvate isomerase family mycothiol-dependent enzyme [Mycobacterium sp.]|uniref:maleylpyruvate isomerase family mycothiol-dependent enzyme n=1 Tax=Mycobacterium sp. TaxID=1785 RepID=UPI002D345370|nr:maleylpyruvate isomerase family mycothiol-dependent enzyme [Mycobacterium sp.]HZU48883.1 maleylpyruvate isomerase family mycothiol-dependent enzyme [Mycobacterium sp.]